MKMNSGMNRLGFRPSAYRDAYARLRAIDQIRHIGLMTHFANADDDNHPVLAWSEQARRFRGGRRLGRGTQPGEFRGDLLHPEAAADWVRPGIMLYGGTPGG